MPVILEGNGIRLFVNTEGTHYIYGHDGIDVILAMSQGASIYAYEGDDILIGSDVGGDYIVGGLGDDYIQANGGNDTVFDTDGFNTVYLGEGDDMAQVSGIVYGGSGDDYIYSYNSLETDIYYGEDGNDSMSATGASPNGVGATLDGGNGDDHIHAFHGIGYGGDGNDDITTYTGIAYGGNGDDIIEGNGNGSLIYGEDGNDTMKINYGTAYGGNGNDTIEVIKATAYGEAGDDIITVVYSNRDAYGGDGNDIMTARYYNGIELFGDNGDDTLIGEVIYSGHATIFIGGEGADTIYSNINTALVSQDTIIYNAISDSTSISMDEIYNFETGFGQNGNHEDHIQLDSSIATQFSDLTLNVMSDHTIITDNDSDFTLKVDNTALNEANFIFV